MRALLMGFSSALLLAGLSGGPAWAQAALPPALVSSCENCHGASGPARTPQTPRLNGQTREYLEARLKDLRNPGNQTIAAIHAMLGPARSVSDDTIAALAAHYAAQAPAEPSRPEAERAAGARLYAQGRGAEIPSCGGCHGARGEGIGESPRLAGQPAAYLEEQLAALMLTARVQGAQSTMNKHAWAMSREDMRALALFLAHD